MKKKFSKILGVGLTLALITSLLLTAAPVMANVSQPTVDVDETEISFDGAEYTISFRINTALVEADDPTITIDFPDDTDVTDVGAGDITIEATSGIGSGSGTVTTVTATPDPDDDSILEIELDDLGLIGAKIGAMAYLQVTIADVTNPSEPDTYTLEVQTSEEDTYVESEEYDIDAPTVGGFVYVYNPSNILLATYGGSAALDSVRIAGHFAKADYTIKVGAGSYELAANITITGEGLTLESADGAEDVIIDANTFGFIIGADEVTIDGFTIDDAGTAVRIGAEDDVVTNCVITDATTFGVSIAPEGVDATVSDCVFEDCATGIGFAPADPATDDMGDVDITGNEITGADADGAIVFGGGNVDIDITSNTITGNDVPGIYFVDGSGEACDDIDIVGNTISENDAAGIEIAENADFPTDLIIKENTIADNTDEGILIAGWTAASDYIMFNDISSNDTDVDNTSGIVVNARFNWWGSADEDDFAIGDDIDYEPWLMGEWATIASGYAVAVDDVSALSGKDTAGVAVTGMDDDDGSGADIIAAFGYIANPEDALDGAIAFYDLHVVLAAATDASEVSAKVKLYNNTITENSTAYFWTGDFWAECSDQLARDGLIWVDVSEDTVPALEDLEATPFAVVAGPEVAEELAAPALAAPESGATDVLLRPTFAWGTVADADGYYFELADNANFVAPMVKLDGDLGRLIVTAYAYRTALPYSTAYYWRVKAVSGTADAGDLLESAWASAVFVTMAEPEEPLPPVVVEEQPVQPAPIITIEQPDIVVPLPAETPITPAWIYAIIGVGAVLIIALLVLIVRTRRVA